MRKEQLKERIYNYTKEQFDKANTLDELGKANEILHYYRMGIIDSTPDGELFNYALMIFNIMWDTKFDELTR